MYVGDKIFFMLSLAISCCWMCGWVFVKCVSMLVHWCAIFSHMSWRLECLLRNGWVCLVLAVSVVIAMISEWGCKTMAVGSSGTHDHTQQVFQDACECRLRGRWRWMQKYRLTSERVHSLQENAPVMTCSTLGIGYSTPDQVLVSPVTLDILFLPWYLCIHTCCLYGLQYGKVG